MSDPTQPKEGALRRRGPVQRPGEGARLRKKSLLENSQRVMIEAQQNMLNVAMAKMEQKTESCFASLETHVAEQVTTVQQMENSIKDLEQRLSKVEDGGSTVVLSDNSGFFGATSEADGSDWRLP